MSRVYGNGVRVFPVDTPRTPSIRSGPVQELKRRWGQNVQGLRRTRGLTQAQLGTAAQVTQQTISSLERGDYAPRDQLKIRIAQALDVDAGVLFPLTWDNQAVVS